ncbi:MAG: hypothetical protein IT326_02055 [Anaerolineae bacterium]|nr:hypothetical protein [Anaerolineae bacterium]
MNASFRLLLTIAAGVIALLTTGCAAQPTPEPTPHPNQPELAAVIEAFYRVEQEAYLTRNPSEAPTVATGRMLDAITNKIASRANVPTILVDDYEITGVTVIEYSPEAARVQVRSNYHNFVHHRDSDTRAYSSGWRWRVVEYALVTDDGIWKVSDATIIESGEQ